MFRYRDGRVSVAHGYRWQRGDSGYGLGNGRIWNDSGPLDVYQERSVFNCGPYLPRIVSATDVSSNYVFDPDNPRAHPGHDDDYLFHEGRFFSLMFTGHNGISRAGQSYSRHVFGLGAPWIPSLVPETYTPPPSISAGLRPSRGLGGDTGTVIGLMALSGTLNHPYEVFRQEVWQERRWNGARVQVTRKLPSKLEVRTTVQSIG